MLEFVALQYPLSTDTISRGTGPPLLSVLGITFVHVGTKGGSTHSSQTFSRPHPWQAAS